MGHSLIRSYGPEFCWDAWDENQDDVDSLISGFFYSDTDGYFDQQSKRAYGVVSIQDNFLEVRVDNSNMSMKIELNPEESLLLDRTVSLLITFEISKPEQMDDSHFPETSEPIHSQLEFDGEIDIRLVEDESGGVVEIQITHSQGIRLDPQRCSMRSGMPTKTDPEWLVELWNEVAGLDFVEF